jgi:hypothetical protein
VSRGAKLRTAVLAAALAVTASNARAGSVSLDVSPLLGRDAPTERGWQPYAVRLRGLGPDAEHGSVELGDGAGGSTRAPFAVGPGEEVLLELYSHDGFGKALEVVVRDASDRLLARAPVASSHAEVPLLVDLGHSARLEAALRGERVAIRRFVRAWAPASGMDLTVTHALVDARSGETLLPDRGIGYESATVVLISSEAFVALPEKQSAALLDWVRLGGCLAVTVSEDADLHHPRLVALFGGTTTLADAGSVAASTQFDVADPETSPSPNPSYAVRSVAPAPEIVPKLSLVTGGGMEESRWGSSRDLGLGEVHALAFDPASPAFVDDPWVRRSVVDLVREAWDRRSLVALAGDAAFDEARTDATRRLLDPNEGSRWSIWFSAILLVIYALLAGPLSFRRAARRGKPLLAFVELPIWSFGAAALIVLVGATAKGGRSRARRLTLIECGAGERRAASVAFRALFASSADSLRVSARDPASLLDVAGSAAGVARSLVLGRDGAELVDLRGRPWETVLVREDGLTNLSGVVRLIPKGADIVIQNGLASDLRAVVAHAPGGELHYFPRIRRGETVRLESGDLLSISPSVPVGPLTPALPSPHRLDSYRFAALADADVKATSDAWSAIEMAGRDMTDYWPDDRAVLIGEIEGGDGVRTDSDLAVDYDRVLLRVVGSARVRGRSGAAH